MDMITLLYAALRAGAYVRECGVCARANIQTYRQQSTYTHGQFLLHKWMTKDVSVETLSQ